jgi:hypothetical protein
MWEEVTGGVCCVYVVGGPRLPQEPPSPHPRAWATRLIRLNCLNHLNRQHDVAGMSEAKPHLVPYPPGLQP